MKMYEAVGGYLKEKGLKKNAVAKMAGIDQSTFYAMMNGKRTMYADDLAAICIALGVPAETFVKRMYGE